MKTPKRVKLNVPADIGSLSLRARGEFVEDCLRVVLSREAGFGPRASAVLRLAGPALREIVISKGVVPTLIRILEAEYRAPKEADPNWVQGLELQQIFFLNHVLLAIGAIDREAEERLVKQWPEMDADFGKAGLKAHHQRWVASLPPRLGLDSPKLERPGAIWALSRGECLELVTDCLESVGCADISLHWRYQAATKLSHPALVGRVTAKVAIKALTQVLAVEYEKPKAADRNWAGNLRVEQKRFLRRVVNAIFFNDFQAGKSVASRLPELERDLARLGWLNCLAKSAEKFGRERAIAANN